MENFIQTLNFYIWGIPMPIIILSSHIFFTFYLKGIQKKTYKGIKYSIKPDNEGSGDISSFATLTQTLAATIGTGNVVGISTAVALGGPGAIFWCWLTGLLGMATTYAESYLGILYRRKTNDNTYIGGLMYALEFGLSKKWLGVFYCFLTLIASFGVGCSTQARAITETMHTLWKFPINISGLFISIIVGLVIVGGIKSISKICTKLVPGMALLYFTGCIIIIFINHNYILKSIKYIILSAFLPSNLPAAISGGFIGSTIKSAARYGIARGLFTNEAGLGTSAIAAASGKTSNPSRQALIQMTATFWDTVVMCAITGIVIVSNILKNPNSIKNYSFTEYTTAAFDLIPYVGKAMLGISLISFAIATLIGWSYFGEKATEYLFGKDSINTYRICYIVMIYIGSVMSLSLIWELTDLVNAFMALPCILCLFLLRKQIKTN